MRLCRKRKPQFVDVNEPVILKKDISIIQGISLVIGIIVGSGIFVSPVGVLLHAKSVGLSLIMWTATGMFSLIGALVYAELGVTLPRSGGEYLYILHSFGPLPAFLAFWITFVVIGAASTAANTMIFADYILKPIFLHCESPKLSSRIIALLGLLFISFLNSYKVKWAARFAVIFTVGKILALLLIIVFGVYYLFQGNVESFRDSFEDSETHPGALAFAFYNGFWAFSGWNYLNFITGEVKNPSKSVPIIIIISILCVTVIYLMVNVAYLAVLSPFEVLAAGEGATAIAVLFAEKCLTVIKWIMPVLVGASVIGSANGEILSMSRLAFTAAEEGHMPSLVAMVTVGNVTPFPAVLLVTLLAIGFQFYEDVFYLIELTGFAFSIIAAMAVLSLIVIRYRTPELNTSGFKLHISIPILFLVVDIIIGILTIYQSPRDSGISLGLMASGIPVYIFGVSWKDKPKSIKSFFNKSTIFAQKLLRVVPQDTVKSNGIQSENSLGSGDAVVNHWNA